MKFYQGVPQANARYFLADTGIGFDDCSAKTEEVPDKEFAASGTFVTEHQDIEAQAWNFYKFNVTDEDYQVIVNVAGETSEDDECGLKPGKSKIPSTLLSRDQPLPTMSWIQEAFPCLDSRSMFSERWTGFELDPSLRGISVKFVYY